MSTPSTDDLLKAKLAELIAQRDAIQAKAAPLRAKRDKIIASIRDEELALRAEITETEKGLFEICQEIGRLAKATGGKAMSDV